MTTMSDPNSESEQHAPHVSGDDPSVDTSSTGSPETPATTDENDRPVDNPSG